MLDIKSHEDCPDDGKVYFPLIGAKEELCSNCRFFDGLFCWHPDKSEGGLYVSWPDAMLCAKYERGEK